MSTQMFHLGGRIALVTGGLGQLGRTFARALLAAGARVVVLDRTDDSAVVNAAFPELTGRDDFMALAADVTDRASLEAARDKVVAAWGEAPHVLVNNAGLDSPPDAPVSENGPFENYPEASWDRVFAVNAKGVFLCCQVFGGAMASAGRGSIINISSIYGKVSPNQDIYQYRRDRGEDFFKPVAYAASKSSLYNLTRYLSTYWARQGVRVNTLTLAGVANNQDGQFMAAYSQRMPIGRMASPDEYVGAIIFLSSEASRYMTGSDLTIDGGWTAW